MRPIRRRFLKAALITIIGAAVLIAVAGPILSGFLNKKIKAKLDASNARIGSLHINLFTRSITIKDFEWSKNSTSATAKNIYAGGIRIIPFLRERKISLRRLIIEGGSISITRDTVEQADQPDSINIKSFDADLIAINDIAVAIKKDSVTEYEGTIGLSVYHMALDSPQAFRDPSAYTFRNIETSVKNFRIQKAGSLYAFKIKEARFDKELKTLHIDSLELEPLLNKTQWAQKVKSQETRVNLKVGSVDAAGITMAVHMQDTSIMISSLTINGPVIHAYKNKKYPFTRKEKFPLPMESFRALSVGIEVDSVKIHKGDITYEELPIEGYHYAWINFEGVEATMSSVNNREFKNMRDHATLEASAHVMKTGEVKAIFKLPLDPKKKYGAEGTISKVPLKELNPLLKDLAFVEITSGRLNKMDFIFVYDDNGSVGQVHFDYEDLRINGLRKGREQDINTFKTLLINTAVKNDQTLNGTIDVARNQKKAVFNLWARSIADGIRSGLMPVSTAKKKVKKK